METRRDVFQAIADPTRRDILSVLTTEPQNLNSIAGRFDMTRQAISLHVKILTECGVITITQKGRERYCSLEPQELSKVADWLEPFKKLWEDRFDNLDHVLKNLKNKTT